MPARPRRTANEAQRYGSRHRTIRAQLARIVEREGATCAETICVEPSRWIPPGSEWHLAHGDDEHQYRGPAHPRCNLAEAARRGNRTRHGHSTGWHSANW